MKGLKFVPLACLAALATAALVLPASAGAPERAEWEYGAVRVALKHDGPLRDYKNVTDIPSIPELEKQGWELVAITPYADGLGTAARAYDVGNVMWMKRRIR